MSNDISSIAALVQNYAQASSASQVQQVAQLTMLKKSQDIQAQSIVPLVEAMVQNSPKPVAATETIGSLLNVKA